MLFNVVLTLTYLSIAAVLARDDGVAPTPPMGWISWTRYACRVDCDQYPNGCVNEQLYKEVADRLVSDGYKDVGYNYVDIDDCWSEMERDSNDRLVADKKRFPSGIKALADYVHSKGLKIGIYGNIGPKTCDSYPGQTGPNGTNYFQLDSETFAEWEVDSFKADGCFEDPQNFDDLFPQMGDALNGTGRPMLYSCAWPLYQWFVKQIWPNYDLIAKTCHIWRNHWDVIDSWAQIETIIDFYGEYNDKFIAINGPGQFFDPDMLVIGGFGLSYEQSRTQMAMWAMWSAPLFMSNDLRNISSEDKKILQNKAVLAVNQDRNGVMAKLVFKVWVKRVEPQVDGQWSYAVIYIDANTLGDRYYMSHKVSDLIPDTKNTTEYEVHDLFLDEDKEILGHLKPDDKLELKVAVGGGCRMVKLLPK